MFFSFFFFALWFFFLIFSYLYPHSMFCCVFMTNFIKTVHILSYQLCSKFDCFRRSTESHPRYHVLNLDQVLDSGGVLYKRLSFSKPPPLSFHNTLLLTQTPSSLSYLFDSDKKGENR